MKNIIKTIKRNRLHRKQRLTRGYSDADMWNSGDHLMGLISESLKWHETQGMSDFSYSFKLWEENGTNFGYKNLKQVYTDIDNYMEFDQKDWANGLYSKVVSLEDAYIKNGDLKGTSTVSVEWYDKMTGRKLTEAKVKKLIDAHHKKTEKLWDKAVNAMSFWARHAREFWD